MGAGLVTDPGWPSCGGEEAQCTRAQDEAGPTCVDADAWWVPPTVPGTCSFGCC